MRQEMRNTVHQLWMLGTLPRSMRRYEKRRERQYARNVDMREYWQEDDAERKDMSAYAIEMDYADAYSNGDDDWKEYADTEKAGEIYSNDDDWDSYYDYGFDYGDDFGYGRLGCRCPDCRPDLYAEARQYGDVTFRPLREQPRSISEVLRNRLQP
jgi:hypothetical protein